MTLHDDIGGRGRWLRGHSPLGPTGARRGGVREEEARPLLRDAPHAGTDWVPLGPTQATGGMAGGRPSVTGRIRDLAIAPGGGRAYAAAANGGVWMTVDDGENWQPLDPWRDTPNANLASHGSGLALGALAVQFGLAPEDDVLFVGCGEPRGWFGNGVRRLGRQVAGDPRVWSDEATHIRSQWSFRLVTPPQGAPNRPDRVWLANSAGLFERPPGGPLDTFAAWTRIALPADYTPVVNQSRWVCDAAMLADGATEYLFVAVWGRGVVRFELDPAGSAIGQVGTPCTGFLNTLTVAERAKFGRITLTAPEDGARRVYALLAVDKNARARLRRCTQPAAVSPQFRSVSGVPGSLWLTSTGTFSGDFCNTLAAVPQPVPAPATATDQVILGGSARLIEDDWQASLYRGTVTGTSSPAVAPTYVGHGAHADVHCARFARRADGTLDRDDLWIATDGGIFRSRPFFGTPTARFEPAHGGLGAFQANYLADHPTVPAFLLAGMQDNGLLIHTGAVTWRRQTHAGDAGGVAVEATGARWMWQYTNGGLYGDRPPATRTPPAVRFPTTSVVSRRKAESDRTLFYTPLRTVLVPGAPAVTRVAFGSHRVWTSDDWGGHWIARPSATNPAASAGKLLIDQLDGSKVESVAWAGHETLLVASEHGVYRLRGIGGAPPTPHDVLARRAGTAAKGLKRPGEAPNVAPPAFATTNAVGGTPADLPAQFQPLCVAPEDAAGLGVYLGLFSEAEPLRFLASGAAQWQSCGLGAYLGGQTNVHAVVADPAHTNEVYVGTDVGVYHAVHDPVAATWAWSDFSFGLPEAAVNDLLLWAPAGSSLRLLRASTWGRGVWEIDVEKARGRDAVASREPEVFLRASVTDDGRRVAGVTRLPDPLDPAAAPAPAGITASPDIVVARGRSRVVVPWPGAVTGAAHDADRRAWRIAAATWGHRLTVGTAAFGAPDKAAWQAIQNERRMPVTNTLNERTWTTTFKGLDRDPDHVRLAGRHGRELTAAGRQAVDAGPNRALVQLRNRGPGVTLPTFTHVVLLFQHVVAAAPVATPAPQPPHPGATIPELPAGWRHSARTANVAALAANGWTVAENRRVPVGMLDPERPLVVGIDLDLTGRAVGDLVALVAIALCDQDPLEDPPTPPEPDRDVVRVVAVENRVALRIVEVAA